MLEALELSPDEQAVYERLLTRAPTTVEELQGLAEGQAWGREAEAALVRLEDLGLVTRLPERPPRYLAVRADAALDALIAARERELAAARRYVAELAERFRSAADRDAPAHLVEVVHERAAALQYWAQFQRRARHEVRMFDAPPYLGRPRECNPVEFELLPRGIRYRVLYDRQALELPGRLQDLEESAAAGEEARFTEVPMKLVLSDSPLAFVPLAMRPEDPKAWLIVREPVLYEALAELFEAYWERALPLQVARGGTELPDEDAPSETDRALLALLVGGLADRAIAKHLGWHERTAHRHLRAMMARLDAATRFQAGYQAVRRGWLTGDSGGAHARR
jgi:sugar-specific transcriptional regulator TrmB/DNA-binding CsgD family transcriptional regulator